MTRREREYVDVIDRRREFLARRIMQGQLRGASNLDYDRHELAALNWTVGVIRRAHPELEAA